MTTKTAITFEEGYEELGRIVEELQGSLPLVETVSRVKRGHGLARSLKDYLGNLEAELREIEEGNGLPVFEIVGLAAPPSDATQASRSDPKPTDDEEIPF